MVGSILFFLFSLSMLVNYALGNLLVSIEDDLVGGLERDHDIRIDYDSISVASFDTVVMRGLKIRHGDTNKQAVLASLASAEIRVRIFPLLFGTKDALETIASVNIEKPELALYRDGSLLDKFGANKTKKDPSGKTVATPKFDVNLNVRNGQIRVYSSDSRAAIPPAAPVAELDFSDIKMELNQNRGSFGIKTGLAVLPGQDLAAGKVDISGILNLDTGSVDALVTTSDAWIAGLGLPELRFFVTREEGQIRVDSSTFGQPVSIDGRWKEGQDGSFILTLDKSLKSFENFVTKTSLGVLGKMFFTKGERYTPSGTISLDIGADGARMAGSLAIEDSQGKPVFRLAATGNQEILSVERLELARGEHLISVSGYWDWKGIPEIAARVRGFEVESASVDANISVREKNNGLVSVGIEGLGINGQYIGSLNALVDGKSPAVVIDGFDGALRGRIDEGQGDTVVTLDCRGFKAGAIAGALAGMDFISGWNLTGNITLKSIESGVTLSGDTVIQTGDYGELGAKFDFTGNEIKLKKLSSDWFTISGTAHREYDGASGRFTVLYNGREWPLVAHMKQTGGMTRAGFEIEGLFSGQADISADGLRASFAVHDLDLHPVGLEAMLAGEGTIVQKGGMLSSGGKVLLQMKDPEIPSVSIEFQGAGKRFDITRFVLERQGHALIGGGTAWIDEQGATHLSMAFANGMAFQASSLVGRFSVVSQFENVDLATIFPGILRGQLDGKAEFKMENSIPDASWNFSVRQGSFHGTPFSVVTTGSPRQGGMQIGETLVVLGDAALTVRNGHVIHTQNGFEFLFNGGFAWKGAPFQIQSRLLAQGGSDEVIVAIADIRFGKTRFPDFSSVVTRSGKRILLKKQGPAGIQGWYSPEENKLDISYEDVGGMRLSLHGGFGDRIDIRSEATGIPLSLLDNFPVMFRLVRGNMSASLHIQGSGEDPDISGSASIQDARFDLAMLRTPLTKFSMVASLTQGTVTLGSLAATNGRGALSVRGKAFIRNGEIDDIDVRLLTDRKHGLDLDLVDPEIRSSGGVLADLFISGNINAPTVQGRIALHDNEFFYMEDSAIPSRENWIKRIRWNMEVAVLDGVSYVNQLVTAMIQPGSSLQLKNSIIDKEFSVNGRVTAARGTFDYINHEFRIEQPTYIEFRRTSYGLDPWLAFRGRLRIKDEELEDVDIYLTFSGPLSAGINPVFSSEPERTQDEIRVLLGIEQPEKDSVDGRRKSENIMLRSTELISLLGLKPLTKEIREWFGLDIFTIRTPIVRNILERESLDALDPKRQLSIFRDTQFSLGKYLTSFMFVEYTLVLKDDTQNYGDVLPTHQVGLELSFDFLNLGYLIKPTEKSGFGEYEQSIELRFRQRF